jgi:hypothetical protein
MTIPGSPDSPPGEESEGIHYFDFSESFESAKTDPFESEDLSARDALEEIRRGHARRQNEAGTREARGAPRDAFESALRELPSQAPSPQGDVPEATFAPLSAYFGREEQAVGQRARFVEAFDRARMWPEQPFLVVALRMPADAPESAWFPLVEQGIRTALRRDDALLVDRERRRLVAVLPGRGADAARPLFANLVAYLRDHIDNAAAVSRRISVFTALNGRPFADGVSFLAHVYDKP